MQQGTIQTHFQDLRRRKAFEEKRDLSLRTIAEETGLALATVQRVSVGKVEGVRVATLGVLCRYFAVSSISELIEYKN